MSPKQSLRPILLSSVAALALGQASPALAQCVFTPTAGDDLHICDSGTSVGGLDDPGGNNQLTLPAGGTGTLAGDVNFGGGADIVVIDSGRIEGAVDQGNGDDSFSISAGTVTGQVQQGEGIDDFVMTGGEIDRLNQGGSMDTFQMTGGRIVDAFDDGDTARMTGGRIGRVNMKLADNLFDMSGGIIDRNLVAGFGNDTIILSGGTIGGNISVSGGTDSMTITGGSVGGDVLMSVGTDSLVWDGGGVVHGTVDLGGDDDSARLANLTNANLGGSPRITGGWAAMRWLTMSRWTGRALRRLENIQATNDSELTFDGLLTLGDAGTGTALELDASSTIFGGAGKADRRLHGRRARDADQRRTHRLTNAAMRRATAYRRRRLCRNDGLLPIDTVLGDDASLPTSW
ncbi:hypothetical protein OVY29_01305 [Sphingopyxis sp. SE2]|uniref:hypothetical protein n=1 Tax=Sphingopyxis sp. SE2 TaxID=1586240 RepID=UPI0028C0E8A5|nr:hypothetical protein [Sphingopyxis sp. SE2]MDT7527303.1 hypothetical protein [Sphingopyxis sp. SE2]